MILDGTDNVETRYLLNDVAVKHGIPWVYGACVGTEGRVMAIRPPDTACLRCVFPEPPGPGELPTCDTAGVLGPAAAIVASLQAVAALKILTGQTVVEELVRLDVWTGRSRGSSLEGMKRPDCPTCGRREFAFLQNETAGRSVGLCGRDAVQIRPSKSTTGLDLSLLSSRLQPCGTVERTPHLLRCRLHDTPEVRLTVFADGRAIIHGVTDPERAKSIYARWIGT